MSNLLNESRTPITASKRKSVFLHEWWLIKVESESKLGVGGFVKRETLGTRGMRILGSPSTGKRHKKNIEDGIQDYGSAAIAKRHDNNTLEAVDGVIIMISGCINKSRTLSYGFSPQVCDGFLSGFPCSWEDYVSKSSNFERKQSLPVSFDHLPVTRVRDLLMSQTDSRALMSIVFRDILKHTENSIPSTDKSCIETQIDQKQDDDVCLSNELNSTKKISEEDCKIDANSHLESCAETEGGGFMSGKVTQEKQLKKLRKRNARRWTQKRKRA